MSVSTLKYCSAPLNWNIYMKFVCGQPLAEQYCFNFTWKSVKIEPILFLKIFNLDVAVFCLVLFFVGYPGDSLHSVCSAGFFFQVHFWAAISCAEHGSQNCPKLIDWGGPVVQSQLGNFLDSPDMCQLQYHALVPPPFLSHWLFSISRLLPTLVFRLWLFVKTQEKLRCPYWAKAGLLLYLNAFVTCEHDEDVTHHTRVAVVVGGHSVTSHIQGLYIWSGLIAVIAKKPQCDSSETFTDKISKDYWAGEPKGIFLQESQTGPSLSTSVKIVEDAPHQGWTSWIYKMRKWLFKGNQNVTCFEHFYDHLDFKELF